jgi:hypothetical protein
VVDRLGHRLFRRHVFQCADHRTGDGRPGTRDGARNAKVHDHRLVFGVDHDVGRLQIPVDHTRFVRRLEPACHLPRDCRGPNDRQSALFSKNRRQVAALDVRHRQVFDAADLSEIMDPDDVLVCDLASEQELAFEPSFDVARCSRIGGDLRPDHFEGYGDTELLVPGLVDRAHASHPEKTDQVVA